MTRLPCADELGGAVKVAQNGTPRAGHNLCVTYIAGIRRRDHVFLVSDSAVTHTGPARRTGYEQVTTSFGEAQIFEASKTVQEGALKLHHLDQIAVAVAGDVSQANRFIAILKARLDRGAPASEQVLCESIESLAELDALAFQFHCHHLRSAGPIALFIQHGR